MKKSIYAVVLVVFAVVLAACSSLNLTGAASTTNNTGSSATQTGQQGPSFSMANMTLEDKLAMGLISLEGTDKAVTQDQAKTLLPLWKAVKSMANSTTASADERTALYKQIEEALTPAQLQAIKDLNLSQEELRTLMAKNGIQGFQGAPQGSRTFPTMSADQRATRQAARTANGGNFAGGGPGAEFGGQVPGGGFPGGNTQPNAQGTPQPRANRGQGGMNFIFINPLITVLEKRAGG